MSLNPWMDRHPFEAETAGRILISYGEIELLVAMCLSKALDDQDVALRLMFRVSGESARIGAADALMRRAFERIGLAAEYADAIGAARFCVLLRNQYAHCHWGDDAREPKSVYFTSLNEPARSSETFDYWWNQLDFTLLKAQWDFMQYTADCLNYLNFEYLLRTEKTRANAFPMPQKRPQPILRNPPEKHIPPWLAEDEKRQHIERFQRQEPPEQDESKSKRPSASELRETRIYGAEKKIVIGRLTRLLRLKPASED